MKSYVKQTKLLAAVDCIIFGFDGERLKLLIIRRGFDPGKGQWSLPGGFVGETEDPDVAAGRVLLDLTGLSDVYMEQFKVFGDPNRDTAARTLSIPYFSLINLLEFRKPLSKAFHAEWVDEQKHPELIFDHNDIVNGALVALRNKAAHTPLLFELLPKKFTLTSLYILYGAVYGKKPDWGNFCRKILALKVLVKLKEKDMTTSKKGSFYYHVNKKVYQSLFTVVPPLL
jgi:8-oxo-dGTP diphosphatase